MYTVVVRRGQESSVHKGKDLNQILRRVKRKFGGRKLIGWNFVMDAYLNENYGTMTCSKIAEWLSKYSGDNVTKNAVISRYHYQRHKRNIGERE
jgi:hypothetical protein